MNFRDTEANLPKLLLLMGLRLKSNYSQEARMFCKANTMSKYFSSMEYILKVCAAVCSEFFDTGLGDEEDLEIEAKKYSSAISAVTTECGNKTFTYLTRLHGTLKALAQKEVTAPEILPGPVPNSVYLTNKLINMSLVRQVYNTVVSRCQSLFKDQLALMDLLPIPNDLEDQPHNHKTGFSFATNLRDSYSKYIINSTAKLLSKDLYLKCSPDSKYVQFSKLTNWESKLQEFSINLLILIHLSYGAPARGTELMNTKITNSIHGARNLYLHGSGFYLFTTYNKTTSLHGSSKPILRFPSKETSTLIFNYIIILQPVLHALRSLLDPEGPQPRDPNLSPYLYHPTCDMAYDLGTAMGEEVDKGVAFEEGGGDEDDEAYSMGKGRSLPYSNLYSKFCLLWKEHGHDVTFRKFRHIVIYMLKEANCVTEDGSGTLEIISKQSGHSVQQSSRGYAVRGDVPPGLTNLDFSDFKVAAQAWHGLMGFTDSSSRISGKASVKSTTDTSSTNHSALTTTTTTTTTTSTDQLNHSILNQLSSILDQLRSTVNHQDKAEAMSVSRQQATPTPNHTDSTTSSSPHPSVTSLNPVKSRLAQNNFTPTSTSSYSTSSPEGLRSLQPASTFTIPAPPPQAKPEYASSLEASRTLKLVYGPNAKFNSPEQARGLTYILDGTCDLIISLPTGQGKSLMIYGAAVGKPDQLIIVFHPVSGVRATIESKCQELNISHTTWNGQTDDINATVLLVHYNAALSYEGLEKLSQLMSNYESRKKKVTIFYDEAHLLVEWDEFMLTERLLMLRKEIPVQMVMLTATIPPSYMDKLMKMANWKHEHTSCIISYQERANLKYKVIKCQPTGIYHDLALDIKNSQNGYKESDRVMVFLQFKNDVVAVGQALEKQGLSYRFICGDTANENKMLLLQEWKNTPRMVMVATITLGIGYDYQAVRKAVVVGSASDFLTMVQLFGRAGRDGNPAECILISNSTRIKNGINRGSESQIQGFFFTRGCLRMLVTHALQQVGMKCTDYEGFEYCSNCAKVCVYQSIIKSYTFCNHTKIYKLTI
jgi:hypothetical protein